MFTNRYLSIFKQGFRRLVTTTFIALVGKKLFSLHVDIKQLLALFLYQIVRTTDGVLIVVCITDDLVCSGTI